VQFRENGPIFSKNRLHFCKNGTLFPPLSHFEPIEFSRPPRRSYWKRETICRTPASISPNAKQNGQPEGWPRCIA
jgi:hypothetical protein